MMTPRCRSLAVGMTLAWPLSAHAAPTEPGELAHALERSSECTGFCHVFPNAAGDRAQPYYAAGITWAGSLMANAARDPVFWGAVALAAQDDPEHTQACIRCHAPRAYLEGRGHAIAMDELDTADLEGVGCDLCHRMVDEGLIGNARYTIDDVAVLGNVPRRGPWDYAEGIPEPEHAWMFDAFVGTSESCGVCHDVTTPRERLDHDGQPMGMLFSEQRTYSEWRGSAFSVPGEQFASCQDCHMPAVADKPGCRSHRDSGHLHEHGGRRHDLVGVNRFMLELLKATYGDAGSGEIADGLFDHALERTDAFVQTAARLQVEAPTAIDLTQGMAGLAVRVENLTGHKLPTGYSEGRVMWIEVIGRYRDEVVFSSGRFDPETGIERDPQLRTYEAIAENFADGTTFHLLRNDHWVRDTRIPPLGLRPDPQTDPVGERYALQDDGTWPNFDEHTYAFGPRPEIADTTPLSPDGDMLELSVRLLYLINTREYIDTLRDDNVTNDAGVYVAQLFAEHGHATPVVLAQERRELPITAFGTVMSSETGVETTASTTKTHDTTGTTSGSSGTMMSDDDAAGCACTVRGRAFDPAWLLALLLLPARRRSRRGRRG